MNNLILELLFGGIVFYALIDNVVDRYFPVLDGLETEVRPGSTVILLPAMAGG